MMFLLLQMFNIYMKRAAEFFGVIQTREIYEKAIELLPDDGARWVWVWEAHKYHSKSSDESVVTRLLF